jgi:DNA modification methylase
VFTDWRMWVNLFDVVESSGFGVRSMIVWDKSSPGMGRGWRSQHELVMWGARETPPFDKHASGQGNVVQAARTGNDLHTTQKPVDLVAKLLSVVPFAGTVYDPFAGSGTTLIAAHLTGRTAYLCEMDPAYADVIARRWQEHVGDLPVLESTGEAVDFTLGDLADGETSRTDHETGDRVGV